MNRTLHTYVNPIAIPDIPRGKDNWYRFEHEMFSHENKPKDDNTPDYRSISDPTVFYYDNKWYLYPSYGMAWVTEDFKTWKHHRTEPYCPLYSPCITPWKDKFLLTSWNCPLYVGDTPVGPFEKLGSFIDINGNEFVPCDPCIFTDDDGRIYLYAFGADAPDKFKIIGYELDKDEPRRVVQGPVDILKMDPRQKPWERFGTHNQDIDFGWVEGPHLLKYNGRYYMIYAAPDTCARNYCMAVYYSDESPLYGFICQKKNPLTIHTNGIVSGAGHGCVEVGPNDTLWAFYTVATPIGHMYERRIGMDMVAVDENGELYCPFGVTDTPQYIPGYVREPLKNGNSPELYNLTGGMRPITSSTAPGRDAIYATDENNLSFWQPSDDDKAPTVEVDLMGEYYVGSVRLFWRDIGLDYAKGIVPKPVCYILEGCYNGEWFTLCDGQNNNEELNIDYQSFEMRKCNRVRLNITSWGKGLKIGLIDFAAFGRKEL